MRRRSGLIVSGVGAVLSAGALASSPPPIDTAQLAAGVFPSPGDAARAAARQFVARSAREDREYLGGVFSCAGGRGGFAFSAGVGEIARDEVTVRIRVPHGCRLVALWHTHGAPHYSREYFSDVDTALAERLGIPFYLAAPSGALRVFAPGGEKLTPRQTRRLRLGTRAGYARGERIGSAS